MKASIMLEAGLAHAFSQNVDATAPLATSSAVRDCSSLYPNFSCPHVVANV